MADINSSDSTLTFDKGKLLKRIEDITDTVLLRRITHILDGDEEEKDEYEQIIEQVLITEEEDELLAHKLPPFADSPLVKLENLTAGIMFWFSLATLCLLGVIIMLMTSVEVNELITPSALRGLKNTYAFLMLVPVIELLIILFFMLRFGRPESVYFGDLLLRIITIPIIPLRMMMPRLTASEWIWLPFLGWGKKNHALFNKLRHDFSVPMIIIALLIIPIALIDYRFQEPVQAFIPNIQLYLEVGQAFIWVAFTFEFMLMFSVTDEKTLYCTQNWMDLIIILLPLVSFLRTLRVFRAFQGITRIQQLGRLYRLRGTLTKMRQALVLAEAVKRLIHPNPESQLRGLQKKLRRNRRDHLLIEQEVVKAVERLKKKHARDAEKQAKQELQAAVRKQQQMTKQKILEQQMQLIARKRSNRRDNKQENND